MSRKDKQRQQSGQDTSLPPVTNETVQNGLAEAVGLGQFNPFNMPQGQGFAGGEQLSGVNTIFKNLRWNLVSNYRQLLSELYVEIGLVQTIVDLPVDDALRDGLEVKSSQLDEDQIRELKLSLERDGDIVSVGQAAKWNRLFGGAGNIVLTDQDPTEPLDVEAIGPDTPLDFRAADLWELSWTLQNVESLDEIEHTDGAEFFNYYGEQVHKSRVRRMKGLEAPSFIRPRLRGWGFSVVEKLVRSINQYLKSSDLSFEVLDEFKLDVYKIKNLVNTLLSPNGEQKVQQRIRLANWQKNYQNAVVMDSEDDFDHKQLSFSGLAEAQTGIRKQVAADMRMPLTKLFGASESGGIGNNDQNDLENYNAMVESEIRHKIKPDLHFVCELKCQKLFGFIPDDLEISFKPLRILTAEQEENVKTQKFNRLMAARERGEITRYEFREACNKGNLIDVTLDTRGDRLNPDDPEIESVLEADPVGSTGQEVVETDGGDEEKQKEKAMNKLFEAVDRVFKNSVEYDKAAYEADGGDAWVSEGRREFFEGASKNKSLWLRGEEISVKAFGKVKWQFVTWWYIKQRGEFK
jgi:phage-related protein (TIGR01555 family)